MEKKTILLVEDNADDEILTRHAHQENDILNEVIVVRDGVEAMDYLSGTGRFAGRDRDALPAVVLLDLNLPRLDGLEVLRRLRGDARTRLLPRGRDPHDLAGGTGSGRWLQSRRQQLLMQTD